MLQDLNGWRRERRFLRRWDGSVPVPHSIKQRIVRSYAREFKTPTLVETGTHVGDMAAAASRWFREIHTIELHPTLAARARERFRGTSRIHVYEGDSAAVLPDIVGKLSDPTLFWLDAHYSGGITTRGEMETPIEKELEIVLAHPCATVVLIDDARRFGTGDYPSLESVSGRARRSGRDMTVHMDIIRIT